MTKQLADEITEGTSPIENESKSAEPAAAARPISGQVQSEVRVDDAGAAVCYANFCRVTGTPEELILDFGLNSQPFGAATNIEVKQRLIVNYFTAKRLLQALGMSIHRHENAFGVLETDVQKRVMPAAARASG